MGFVHPFAVGANGPEVHALRTVIGASPSFVSMTVCGADSPPTTTGANSTVAGDTTARGATPVPVAGTLSTHRSVQILMLPVRSPRALGKKVMSIGHVPPPGTGAVHPFVAVNSAVPPTE
jgi:hypothetical protein